MSRHVLNRRFIVFATWCVAAWSSIPHWQTLATTVSEEKSCSRCGCHAPCRKVCRLKYEEKKVAVTIWSSETEEFCEPGVSRRTCKHCEKLESNAPNPECQCQIKAPFVWWEWLPFKSPTIHERHKLMKKSVTKTIPSYRWVIEDLCAECAALKQ